MFGSDPQEDATAVARDGKTMAPQQIGPSATPAIAVTRHKPSLAILPFQNMTGTDEQDYFVHGVVEEITTAFSRLPWLFEIARNSSFTYEGRAADVKQVARESGVRYVLEGSVPQSNKPNPLDDAGHPGHAGRPLNLLIHIRDNFPYLPRMYPGQLAHCDPHAIQC
jgi:hypothetical protein